MRVLISHAAGDEAIARGTRTLLAGTLDVALSRFVLIGPRGESLDSQTPIADQLREHIANVQAVVLILTPASTTSAWVGFEIGIAAERGVPLFALAHGIDPAFGPGPLLGRVVATPDNTSALSRFLEDIGVALGIAPVQVRPQAIEAFRAALPAPVREPRRPVAWRRYAAPVGLALAAGGLGWALRPPRAEVSAAEQDALDSCTKSLARLESIAALPGQRVETLQTAVQRHYETCSDNLTRIRESE